MIAQWLDRKWSGRERGAGSGKVHETGLKLRSPEAQCSYMSAHHLQGYRRQVSGYLWSCLTRGSECERAAQFGPSALDVWKRCQWEDTSIVRPPTLAHNTEDRVPKPVVQKRSPPPHPLHLQGFILAMLNSDPVRGAQVRGVRVLPNSVRPLAADSRGWVTHPKARESLLLITCSTSSALWKPQMTITYNRQGMFIMIGFECWLDKALPEHL